MGSNLKDSSLAWLDHIPDNWKVARFKDFARCRMGETILASDVSRDTGIPIYSATQDDKVFGYIENPKLILQEGDFVIPARGNIGFVTRIKVPVATCTQTTICAQHIHSILTDYLYYCCVGLKAIWFKYDKTAIPQITVKQVENNLVPLPPFDEQQRIAAYLDAKCGVIDELIAIEQQMIADLQGYRRSVITEAVTRGLNPAAPIKPAGIPWLGNIPRHWKIARLGLVFDAKAGGDAKPDLYSCEKDDRHPYPVYTNSLDRNQVYAYSEYAPFKSNSITVTGRGDIGRAFLRDVDFDAIIRLLVLTPKMELSPKYYMYFIDEVIPFFSDSAVVGQLSAAQIVKYSVVIPPLDEQQQIAEYLDEKCGDIDTLIEIKQEKISTLKQYRQSLIFEAVTGKNIF